MMKRWRVLLGVVALVCFGIALSYPIRYWWEDRSNEAGMDRLYAMREAGLRDQENPTEGATDEEGTEGMDGESAEASEPQAERERRDEAAPSPLDGEAPNSDATADDGAAEPGADAQVEADVAESGADVQPSAIAAEPVADVQADADVAEPGADAQADADVAEPGADAQAAVDAAEPGADAQTAADAAESGTDVPADAEVTEPGADVQAGADVTEPGVDAQADADAAEPGTNDQPSAIAAESGADVQAGTDVTEPGAAAQLPAGAQEPPAATPSQTPAPTPTPTPAPTVDRFERDGAVPYDQMEHRTLDESAILPQYREIYAENPDLAGWIEIPGTVIDYPVVQSEDSEFYLKHDFFGNRNANGQIILDAKCDPYTPSYNLVISGHSMKSGKMFGRLVNYMYKSYWERHKLVHFDTLMEQKTYVVFAAFFSADYDVDEKGFRYNADIRYSLDARQWLREVDENKLYDTGIDVGFGDEFLTLTTCNKAHRSDGRFVVVCRRLREGEVIE